LAAGLGSFTIDHYDFSVITDIYPGEKESDDTCRQRFLYFYTTTFHGGSGFAFKKTPATYGIQ